MLSLDFDQIAFRGFVIEPTLAYQHDNFLQSDTQLKLSLGAAASPRSHHA